FELQRNRLECQTLLDADFKRAPRRNRTASSVYKTDILPEDLEGHGPSCGRGSRRGRLCWPQWIELRRRCQLESTVVRPAGFAPARPGWRPGLLLLHQSREVESKGLEPSDRGAATCLADRHLAP